MTRQPHLTKHTLWLRTGDMEKMQDAMRNKPISASEIVRRLVSRYVDEVLDIQVPDKLPPTSIDL